MSLIPNQLEETEGEESSKNWRKDLNRRKKVATRYTETIVRLDSLAKIKEEILSLVKAKIYLLIYAMDSSLPYVQPFLLVPLVIARFPEFLSEEEAARFKMKKYYANVTSTKTVEMQYCLLPAEFESKGVFFEIVS
jgi:hypothetical protein